MRLLIFDTETTGLPKSRQPSNKEPNNWPHIVSISWVILDAETNRVEKERSYIVKPAGWTIPEASTKIHGITNEKAISQGVDLSTVMGEFLAENYDTLVAHNLEFDYNVIHNAIQWDLGIPFGSLYKKMICTMELSRNICKLRTAFGSYKSPKLSELYEFVFKKSPNKDELHSSIYDVLILTEIVQTCQELRSKMNLPTTIPIVTTQNATQENGPRVLSFRFE